MISIKMVRPHEQNVTGKIGEQVLLATLMRKRPRDQERTRRRNDISNFAWSRLGVHPTEQSDVAENREVYLTV